MSLKAFLDGVLDFFIPLFRPPAYNLSTSSWMLHIYTNICLRWEKKSVQKVGGIARYIHNQHRSLPFPSTECI